MATQRCDVRVESDVDALVAATVDRFGAVDVAFANAGTGSFAPVVDVDPTEWMRVIEINLLGPLLTVKHAARQHGGRRLDHPHREPERGAAGRGHERVLLLEGRAGDARAGRGDGARPAAASA